MSESPGTQRRFMHFALPTCMLWYKPPGQVLALQGALQTIPHIILADRTITVTLPAVVLIGGEPQ